MTASMSVLLVSVVFARRIGMAFMAKRMRVSIAMSAMLLIVPSCKSPSITLKLTFEFVVMASPFASTV